MSEKTFELEMVTPRGIKFDGPVSMVQLPGVMGQMGILAGHAKMLSILQPGLSCYESEGKRVYCVTGSGLVRVNGAKVSVLVETVEYPGETPVTTGIEVVTRESILLKNARAKLASMSK